MAPHRCPGRIRRVPGAYRFWALFALLTLAPSTAVHTLAASVSLQIPVKAIGALPLTAVTVDYLRDDRTVARQVPNAPLSDGLLRIATVPGSSELRISAEGFEPVVVSVANASLGVSLPALSRLTVKWPFRVPSKMPPSVDLNLVPRKGRPPSSKPRYRKTRTGRNRITTFVKRICVARSSKCPSSMSSCTGTPALRIFVTPRKVPGPVKVADNRT